MVANAVAALQRLGAAERSVEESVSFTLAHRIRIEILAALHEGPATVRELGGVLRLPRSTLDYHIKEMLKDGAIGIARSERVRNFVKHVYCMVELPYYSDEEVAAMTRDERQALISMILQAAMAEALASLWAGKMVDDPRIFLAWNRVNLDRRGRADLSEEQTRSWARQHEIEAESANRMAESGKTGITYVISLFGFERCRTPAPKPAPTEKHPEKKQNSQRRGNQNGFLAKALAALQRLGAAERSVEESVSFTLAHRIRIEILAALHEGPASAKELAAAIRQPLSTLDYHIKEMLKDGAIDVAKTMKVGNLVQHFYCMIELPYYSDEEVAAMTRDERQALISMILQAAMAEALASLWAGKMVDDHLIFLAWNRVTLDIQGRADLSEEQTRSWARQHEIEAESANRMAESGETGITYVISSLGYMRSRTSAPAPLSPDAVPKPQTSGNYLSLGEARSTGEGSLRNV
jgi:DNA-binding transcriptional ArsR family regulator